jgi:prepilin-type N-terminal cleavage/methylation domain-containing protein
MRRRGLTLIELLIVVTIVSILAVAGTMHYLHAQTRAKVAASKGQLRNLAGAIEVYRIDHGAYPYPKPVFPDDPLGVLASTALRGLTTPVAYVGRSAFHDPFGELRLQVSSGPLLQDDPFRPPEPGAFNKDRSLLFISYPRFSKLVGQEGMNTEAYAVISIGPDLKDSLIAYFPFPGSLPSSAAEFGIEEAGDTVYDPTNGVASGGDLAWFGGELPVQHLVGGGDR